MSMGLATLVLRDVHVPASPSWWPLAPGWWLVLGGLFLLAAGTVAWRVAVRRRRRTWQRWFDAAGDALTPAGQVAAMSERLRRAARRLDPSADRLEGDAWLRFLDGEGGGHAFGQSAEGDGREGRLDARHRVGRTVGAELASEGGEAREVLTQQVHGV